MQQTADARRKEGALKGFENNPFAAAAPSSSGGGGGEQEEGGGGPLGVEEGMEWYRWARFKRDALPSWTFISLEQRIENERGRLEVLKSQLEEVRLELEDLGEVMELVLGEEVKDPLVAVRLNERAEKEEKEEREKEFKNLSFAEKYMPGGRAV